MRLYDQRVNVWQVGIRGLPNSIDFRADGVDDSLASVTGTPKASCLFVNCGRLLRKLEDISGRISDLQKQLEDPWLLTTEAHTEILMEMSRLTVEQQTMMSRYRTCCG